jgi:hypothetical protein
MVAEVGEGTMRVLNLEICGLSWKVGVVGGGSGVVLGVAVDDVERRKAIDIPMVDEVEVVWVTTEVGAKNATCEVGAASLAAAGDVSEEGTSVGFVFALDVDEGPSALGLLEARAVRADFEVGSFD